MSSRDSSNRPESRRPDPQRSEGRPAPQPERGGNDASGTGGGSRQRIPGGRSDFGSFVSSTARSSGDLFKTSGTRRSARTTRPTGDEPVATPAAGTEDGDTREPAPRRDRPRRYWRDSLERSAGPGGLAASSTSTSRPSADGTPAEDRPRGIRLVGREVSGLSVANLSARAIIGILGGLLLLALLLIFALNQFGGDDGDDPTPTSTAESVLGPVDGLPGADSTPADDPAEPTSGPDDTAPPADDEPTATDDEVEPRRGGDNQRDQETETPEGIVNPSRAGLADNAHAT